MWLVAKLIPLFLFFRKSFFSPKYLKFSKQIPPKNPTCHIFQNYKKSYQPIFKIQTLTRVSINSSILGTIPISILPKSLELWPKYISGDSHLITIFNGKIYTLTFRHIGIISVSYRGYRLSMMKIVMISFKFIQNISLQNCSITRTTADALVTVPSHYDTLPSNLWQATTEAKL